MTKPMPARETGKTVRMIRVTKAEDREHRMSAAARGKNVSEYFRNLAAKDRQALLTEVSAPRSGHLEKALEQLSNTASRFDALIGDKEYNQCPPAIQARITHLRTTLFTLLQAMDPAE